jgi:putative sterol carrier protein
MVKYLSEEWATQAKKKVLTELDKKTDLKNMTMSLMNVVENSPPDQKTMYFYVRFVDGVVEELIVSSDPATKAKPAEFTTVGDYATFVQISKGEMSSAMALLKNRVKITGNKMRLLTLTKPIDNFNVCIKKLQTEY